MFECKHKFEEMLFSFEPFNSYNLFTIGIK